MSAAALALPLMLATACSGDEGASLSKSAQEGFLPPEGRITAEADIVRNLWDGAWIAALATGAVVIVLILWACFFHRKRKNSAALPAQVRYNLPIEIFYTLVPLVMVSVFFFFTARDQNAMLAVNNDATVKVKVEAVQWSWRFTTESGGKVKQVMGKPVSDFRQGPQLVLPVDTKVEFQLESPDVIHSFWVPAFLFKRDVIPGIAKEKNRFEVTTLNKPGVYAGRCAELCGVDHSRMLFNVKLVSKQEFEQDLASGSDQ
ncbi:cytochrome c oxidase subunit II [Nonomuraea sp. NPDC050663]|uniref:aa3-type cytochrome oxidase subunit II n=1 Tax=Nonomuraea sp. NPDC050663 TaxID=3364370 RepID=UPI00379B5CF9